MEKKSNIFAILGLVFSLFISALFGIVFSIIGIKDAKKNGGYLKSVAIAGVVVGIIKIISYILLFLAAILFVYSTNNDDICKVSYDCRKGLFGNYECKYISDRDRNIESNSVCSKEQVKKFNTSIIDIHKKKVDIFVFYSSGCPHCEGLFEYLSWLGEDPDYNYMFDVIKIDTWANNTNLERLYKAQEHFGLKHDKGVPFYIIGDKYYSGFGTSENVSESTDIELKKAIKDAYTNGYTHPYDYLDK